MKLSRPIGEWPESVKIEYQLGAAKTALWDALCAADPCTTADDPLFQIRCIAERGLNQMREFGYVPPSQRERTRDALEGRIYR